MVLLSEVDVFTFSALWSCLCCTSVNPRILPAKFGSDDKSGEAEDEGDGSGRRAGEEPPDTGRTEVGIRPGAGEVDLAGG